MANYIFILSTYLSHRGSIATSPGAATMLKERNVSIVVPFALPQTYCDATRVAVVFRNPITNAVKYNDNAVKRVEAGYLDEVTATDKQGTPLHDAG